MPAKNTDKVEQKAAFPFTALQTPQEAASVGSEASQNCHSRRARSICRSWRWGWATCRLGRLHVRQLMSKLQQLRWCCQRRLGRHPHSHHQLLRPLAGFPAALRIPPLSSQGLRAMGATRGRRAGASPHKQTRKGCPRSEGETVPPKAHPALCRLVRVDVCR